MHPSLIAKAYIVSHVSLPLDTRVLREELTALHPVEQPTWVNDVTVKGTPEAELRAIDKPRHVFRNECEPTYRSFACENGITRTTDFLANTIEVLVRKSVGVLEVKTTIDVPSASKRQTMVSEFGVLCSIAVVE